MTLTREAATLRLFPMSSFPRYPRVRSQWREFVTPAIRNLVLACVGVFLIQTMLEALESSAV